jgi:type IV pilus biogenesis protein CpaD/CtpE
MPRPKPAIPVDVAFSTRTTRGERDAIDAMVKTWTAERETALGLPLPADSLTTWFRSTVRKLAAEQGIEVVEPSAAPAPAPAKRRARGA